MSDFINTVDTVGESALVASILGKTITELSDDKIKKLGDYALYNCTKLTTLDLPNLEEVGGEAVYSCSVLANVNFPKVQTVLASGLSKCKALTVVDFPSATKLNPFAFSDCTNLKTLVLRSEVMCTAGLGILGGTAIATGTGYIYVPSALVASYKADSNWSTYASKFRALESYTVDGTITGALKV